MNKKLKIKLIEKGLTMSRMAMELGMTRQYLYMVITGKAPGKRFRKRIADYLEMSEDELFRRDSDY